MAANDNVSPALWTSMKCVAAPSGSTTGNAGRVYGTASGIANATGLATALMATAISAAATIKNDTGAAKLEGAFRLWKTSATEAMTAYEAMATGDNTFQLLNAFKCNVAGSASVVTLVASCTEAEVNVVEASNGTERAKRPANLVLDLTSSSTTLSVLVTAAETECKKLPSMGLYIKDEA